MSEHQWRDAYSLGYGDGLQDGRADRKVHRVRLFVAGIAVGATAMAFIRLLEFVGVVR